MTGDGYLRPAKAWLRAAEVAELLQVSPKTISRWSKEGLLPHHRTLGGHRRYEARVIRALVASLSQSADGQGEA